MRLPDPDAVTLAIRETAELDVLPRFRSLREADIREKKPGDLVTVADIDAERRLTRMLTALLPGSVVVGEEAHHHDPAVAQLLERSQPVWLIDPIDGTRNFADGDSMFCMMVALVRSGETLMAWLHDPVPDRTAAAEKGSGAWLDGARLRMPAPGGFEGMVGQIGFGCFPEADRQRKRDVFVKAFAEVSRLRCAGHDFLLQLRGRRHFALYNRLWMWDHAPGVLVLREAGGHAERIDGEAYRANDRVRCLLTAPNREAWNRLHDFIAAA